MARQLLECPTRRRSDRGGWRRRAAPLVIIALLPIVAATDCEEDGLDKRYAEIRVTNHTTGSDLDPDGFTLKMSGFLDQHIDVNDERTLVGDIPCCRWAVTLSGIAPNCEVSGTNPRGFGFTPGKTELVNFDVACIGAGAVRVTTQTTGKDPDADGFTVTVAGVSGRLDANGAITLTAVRTGATDSVELGGIAGNCAVKGTNPRPVTVTRGATAQVAFDVTCQPITVPVASVHIKPDSADLIVGATGTYTARTSDAGGGELTGRTITWSVADAGVATVDPMAGVVTGVAPGATTVTAMSEGITDDAIVVVVSGLGGNLLVDPSFEDTVHLGQPTVAGVWSGDVAAVVPAEQGITPFDGASMLRFLASSEYGPDYESDSEMRQLVDVRAFRAAIDGGQVKADALVRVNRIAGPQSDTRFELELWGFPGDCSTYPRSSYPLYVETYRIAGDDLNTWELLTFGAAGVAVPPGTDCLVFTVVAREDRIDEVTSAEFVGHYADLAELRLRM